MSVGVVRVLPPDHPLLPEMVDRRDPVNRECPGDIKVWEAEDLLRPIATPWTSGFWCTRTAHPEGTPHACLAGRPVSPAETTDDALIVWGGE